MAVMSCVFIPYPVKPDVVQSEAITLSAEHTMVTLSPRKLLEKIAKEIQGADDNIEVVDGLTFRDLAFPDGDWTLSRLLERDVCERVREQLDVAYLVLVGPMTFEEGEPKGHFLLSIGGYGAAQVDTESTLSAVIVDLQTQETVCQVTSEAHGKQTWAGLFYFVVTIPMTDPAAIRGLGDGVAKAITERAGAEPIRIAVMAGESVLESSTERTEAMEERINALKVRAEAGDAEAQLQLYYVERRDRSSLKWLCRAADQGQRHAQNELASEYRRGIHFVKRNLVEAYVWYSLAVQGGAIEYRDRLEELTAAMTPEQIDEAERQLDAWTPGQCERDLVGSNEY